MNDDQLGTAVGSVLRELYPEGVRASRPIALADRRGPGPRSRRSRAALGISATLVTAAVAGIIVILLSRPQATSAPSAGSAGRPTPPSASAGRKLVLPEVVGDRLTRPYSLDAGQLQLAPAPVNARPGLTVDAARTRGWHYRWIDGSARSSVFLAVLTSYARATDINPATGRLRPNIDKRLVWVLFQRDVPQHPTGPGAPIAGSERTSSLRPDDVLSVRFNALDARTGKNIEGDDLTNVTDNPAATTAPK